MKVALLTNIVSPHQLPLAHEIVKRIGAENYRYAYTESFHAERAAMGWGDGAAPDWCRAAAECREFLQDADLVYCEERDLNLFEHRLAACKKTFYVSERWFKPILLFFGLSIPGIFKLLSPRYFSMARRFVRFFDNSSFLYLPQGVHAARDMARLCGLMHGDLSCLFRTPKLEFEKMPGGRVGVSGGVESSGVEELNRRYCLDKIRMWGYFVEQSKTDALPVQEANDQPANQLTHSQLTTHNSLHVLWVGRLLKLKRADTIIRAVGELFTCSTRLKNSLDIYGTGPDEPRLKKMAAKYGDAVKFYPPVPIAEVRELMRQHDVYVFTSNSFDGWGAVVSEALEEGMKVIGTYEAGASATILPRERLFRSGDYKSLVTLLKRESKGELPPCSIGEWTAKTAAGRLLELAG